MCGTRLHGEADLTARDRAALQKLRSLSSLELCRSNSSSSSSGSSAASGRSVPVAKAKFDHKDKQGVLAPFLWRAITITTTEWLNNSSTVILSFCGESISVNGHI